MKYTTDQIREAVIAELKDRLLIPDVEKLHIVILDAAFKRLPDRLPDDTKTMDDEPYFGWCNVKGCENEGCSGGVAWNDTGHWIFCSRHSLMNRKGKPQPKMKQKSIERENSRDENRCLPLNSKD